MPGPDDINGNNLECPLVEAQEDEVHDGPVIFHREIIHSQKDRSCYTRHTFLNIAMMALVGAGLGAYIAGFTASAKNNYYRYDDEERQDHIDAVGAHGAQLGALGFSLGVTGHFLLRDLCQAAYDKLLSSECALSRKFNAVAAIFCSLGIYACAQSTLPYDELAIYATGSGVACTLVSIFTRATSCEKPGLETEIETERSFEQIADL